MHMCVCVCGGGYILGALHQFFSDARKCGRRLYTKAHERKLNMFEREIL
jgi:hypothetical protein